MADISSGKGWLDRLVDFCAILAGVLLCGLTVLICLDVAARYLRLFAMPWSLDVAEYLLYHITFLGAPWVLREGGHIAIDLLVQRLSDAARHRLVLATHLVGAIVCATLLFYSCRVWWASYRDGTLVHETFVFPEWTLFTIAPPTFLMLLAVFVRWLFRPPADAAGEADQQGL